MPRGAAWSWSRLFAVATAVCSAAYVLAVLGFGYLWITTDWSAWACFDDDEPACSEPASSHAGLSAVRTSSWLLASLAVIATLAALLLAFRARRRVHLATVILLCIGTAAIGQALWSRL